MTLLPRLGCSAPPDAAPAAANEPAGGAAKAPPVRFVDVTVESGIDYALPSGTNSTYPMPAVIGGGLAVFDAALP